MSLTLEQIRELEILISLPTYTGHGRWSKMAEVYPTLLSMAQDAIRLRELLKGVSQCSTCGLGRSFCCNDRCDWTPKEGT